MTARAQQTRRVARPTYSFLALAEHPYARAMLARLLAAGYVPASIVLEDSSVATEEREKFLARIAGHPLAPTIAEQAAGADVPVHTLPEHTSDALLALYAGRPLDLLVLGGTRILRGPILSYPRHGVVNSHPGLLPECRGSASPAWSVYHDLPIGASTHFCDEGIDTGDLLLRRELAVTRGETYEDLCYRTLVLAGELMAEALVAYDQGRWPELRRPQGTSTHPTFRNAPPEVLERVRQKLADQSYARYVD